MRKEDEGEDETNHRLFDTPDLMEVYREGAPEE